MWITAAEFARMERAIEDSLQRAIDAEKRLAEERKRLDDIVASERQSKDWMTLQMASRVVTKHGGYGLNETSTKIEPTPHPKGFVREPEEVDSARLQYYVRCYQKVGKSADEAQQLATQLWEAEMRGENVTYEYEQEQ
jgi:hypothetical protein